jgi:hypothetical protein
MKIHVLIFTIILAPFYLQAEPPFKKYLDIGSGDPNKKCSTVDFYDVNTAVTFFGDSRIDLVDNIAYGAASLDHYMATYGAWNVQNFGVIGMIPALMKKCMTKTYHEWVNGKCIDNTSKPPPPIVVQNPNAPNNERPAEVPPPRPAVDDNTLLLLAACFFFGACHL